MTSTTKPNTPITTNRCVFDDLIWWETTVEPKARSIVRKGAEMIELSSMLGTVAAMGYGCNTLPLLAVGRSLLWDVSWDHLEEHVDELAAEGFPPAGIVLPHNHIVGWDDAISRLQKKYTLEVMLHPADFTEPTTSSLLHEFGVEILHFPGHSAGHVVLYRERDQLMLVSDAATGTSFEKAAQNKLDISRTPAVLSRDDTELRQSWIHFDRLVVHLSAFHGASLFGSGLNEERMASL